MKAQYVWFAFFSFVGSGIIFAPASLVSRTLKDFPEVSLTGAQGTIWNGQVSVSYQEKNLGLLNWTISPMHLYKGALLVKWELSDVNHDVTGTADLSFNKVTLIAAGYIDSGRINRELNPYNIAISGRLTIDIIEVSLDVKSHNPSVDGNISWNGGRSTYRLAGKLNAIDLPPLKGRLTTTTKGPILVVTDPNDDTIPLIVASIDAGNWANIGITKRFTNMVGQAWQGNESPETVVLRVEEKLF